MAVSVSGVTKTMQGSTGSCFRPRRNMLLGLLTCTVLLILVTQQFIQSPPSFFQIQNFIRIGFFYDDYENSNFNNGDSFYTILPMEPGALCNIPRLDPFSPVALRRIAADEVGKNRIKCLEKDQLVKFYTEHGNLVRVQSSVMEEYWNTVKCCYNGYWGTGNPANESSTACEPISQISTKIPAKYDFINVKCYKWNSDKIDHQDQFQFFRLRTSKSKPPKFFGAISRRLRHRAPNVIFFGLDSVSHVNFVRSFRKSHEFLVDALGAIEFFGQNKISVSTQGNLMAMLTGCKLAKNSQIPELLPPGKSCDLVWNQFRKKNYSVARAEDDLGLNNDFFPTLRNVQHQRLTEEQITDYNWAPYIREMKRINVAKGNQFTFGCFDYQWVQNMLIDRIYDVAESFESHGHTPYFHFSWTATTAHDVIGYARYLDDPLHTLLTNLASRQLLNNTIFILASDHGMAYGTYSRTNAGSIEARMPLLYFVFPAWFQDTYKTAMENLKANAMRLTTPFDLHETLLDLADLRTITDEALEHRALRPKLSRNKGMTLFLPVPANRTCESAGIPQEWCICWTKSSIEYPDSHPDIQQAVQVGLADLNSHLRPFAKCAQLQLEGIETARQLTSKLVKKSSFEIVFKTKPGGALYEVSVAKTSRQGVRGSGDAEFQVLGDIVRVNAYGDSGACLEDYKQNQKRRVPYLVNSACHCLV